MSRKMKSPKIAFWRSPPPTVKSPQAQASTCSAPPAPQPPPSQSSPSAASIVPTQTPASTQVPQASPPSAFFWSDSPADRVATSPSIAAHSQGCSQQLGRGPQEERSPVQNRNTLRSLARPTARRSPLQEETGRAGP